jgi:hypothetical protein
MPPLAVGPTQRPIQWVPGGYSQEGKRSEREVELSPPSNVVVVNNKWSCTSSSPLCLHDMLQEDIYVLENS